MSTAWPGGRAAIWHTATMAWLVSEARVFASAEVADSRSARRRGLLGRDGLDGALVIQRCRWIHTLGMRFPIDVAYLDHDGAVAVLGLTRAGARHKGHLLDHVFSAAQSGPRLMTSASGCDS